MNHTRIPHATTIGTAPGVMHGPLWRKHCAPLAALAGLCVGLSPAWSMGSDERPTAVYAQVDAGRGTSELITRALPAAAGQQDQGAAARRREIENMMRNAGEAGDQETVDALGRELQELNLRMIRQAGGAPGGMITDMPAAIPAPMEAVGALRRSGEPIPLNFVEPVDLATFTQFVATSLGINIFTDQQLVGKTVQFNAPLSVPPDELMPLLETLIEDQGFALTFNDKLGIYQVVQAANVSMGLRGEQATTRIIRTPLIRPSSLQQTILTSIGPQAQTSVRLSPVDDIGVMIVTATPATGRKIEELVSRIVAEVADMRLFRFDLDHVSADFAVNRILQLNGKLGGGQQGFVGAAQGQVQQGVPAGAPGGSLSSLDARLLPDQSNAVIFRGTEAEAALVQQLVDIVDVVTPLVTRVYLAGRSAQLIAEMGQRMGLGPVLAAPVAGGSTLGFNTGLGTQRFSGVGAQGAGQELTGSGFIVDAQTNAITYFGTEAQHRLVAELVRTYTEQAVDENIELVVYRLLYIKAEDTAALLNEIIQDPSQRSATSPFLPRGQQGSPSAAAARPPGAEGDDVTALAASADNTVIVADASGNQLLIKATARAHRQFERLIAQIDRRKSQVQIEARIVSVTTNKAFDWTIDVQINAGQFSFLSAFGLTGGGTTIQDVRTVPAPTGTTFPGRGATAALVRSDFVPFAFSALETIGDLKIVSNPRILANDNEEATVESVRNEPFSQQSQTAGNPLITTQGGSEEAGTKLTVTPQISSGGDLVLEYEIELSSFDFAGQQPGLSPPKQRESYKSKVTLPSDMTVVVGGFTIDRKGKNTNRVPVLGWIPILGAAFSDYSDDNLKTTIFVFITPTILNNDNFLDLSILSEGWIEKAGLEQDRPPMKPAIMPISDTAFAPTPLAVAPGEPADATRRRRRQ